MRILIVPYCYWPSANPRAFRWTAIAEQWAREGHHVDVICEPSPGHAARETVNGVHLHRSASSAPAAPASPPVARRGLRKWLRWAWRSLYWPDYAFRWHAPASRLARALLEANRYNVVYSSSVPFTSHMVVLAARKLVHGRWIADIGDPFSFADGASANNFALYGRLNRWIEAKLFRAADAVTVTTRETLERYAAIFPFAAEKLSVIPPLLTASPQETQKPAGLAIKLVFVGTLYNDIRSPAPLLECFERLSKLDGGERLELHFYGHAAGCEQHFAGTDPRILVHGPVPQPTAVTAMRDADILVNIGNNSEYQLPSKVVEYLAMMKPILNFVGTARDSSAGFLADYDAVLSISGDQALRDPASFDRLADFVRSPPAIDPVRRAGQLAAFRPERLAAEYMGLGG